MKDPLIKRLNKHDHTAFEEIVHKYLPLVSTVVYNIGESKLTKEDMENLSTVIHDENGLSCWVPMKEYTDDEGEIYYLPDESADPSQRIYEIEREGVVPIIVMKKNTLFCDKEILSRRKNQDIKKFFYYDPTDVYFSFIITKDKHSGWCENERRRNYTSAKKAR